MNDNLGITLVNSIDLSLLVEFELVNTNVHISVYFVFYNERNSLSSCKYVNDDIPNSKIAFNW